MKYETKDKNRLLAKADLALMESELHADGINTHIKMRKGKCPLYGTDFEKKIAKIVVANRRMREYLRRAINVHQRTLTTRSKKFTDNAWEYQGRTSSSWDCPFCRASPERGLIAECWFCHAKFTKKREHKECRLFICPACGKCGCNLSEDAREKVYITLNAVFRTDYWKLAEIHNHPCKNP